MDTTQPDDTHRVWVITRTNHIFATKNFLQARKNLNKTLNILRGRSIVGNQFSGLNDVSVTNDYAAIPTTLFAEEPLTLPKDQADFAAKLGLSPSQKAQLCIIIASKCPECSASPSSGREKTLTPADQINLALKEWFDSIPSHVKSRLPHSASKQISNPAWRYTIYGSLVVLSIGNEQRRSQPHKTGDLRDLLLNQLGDYKESLGRRICERLETSHVGLNAPIPLTIPGALPRENVLRAPSGFICIYGDFGKMGEMPNEEGFENTYWANARQNGIEQVFAPLHTMFSRGNITEKQRILNFEDLNQPRAHKIAAIDLYAGIGYFAFSYAKTGVDLVLGWELNKWSIEGFRRGAVKNKWKTRILQESEPIPKDKDDWLLDQQFVLFNESNEQASNRIHQLRDHIPAITHVNCGYLPTSGLVWEDAVRILDPNLGGYVHAHENIALADIDKRRGELINLFDQLANKSCDNESEMKCVTCTHVERLKSYAPGVWHCVFDVLVAPRSKCSRVREPPIMA